MRHICASIVATAVLAGASFAATINVPGDYPTIQGAIDVANDGDEIIVAPGTYTGSDDNVVDMLGKALTLRSSGGPDVTFIDGQDVRRGIICQGGETNTTVIEGFKIINCFGVAYDYYGNLLSIGGGMLCTNSASPSLANCILSFNWADYGGGLFAGQGCILNLANCTFTYGTAVVEGGALYLHYSDSILTQCYFANCTAGNDGGGMLIAYSEPSLEECNFHGNTALEGGALSNHNSSPALSACTFTGNTASYVGGGMRSSLSDASLTGCTFTNNSADLSGGAIWLTESEPNISNCTFTGNTATKYFGGGILCYLSSPEIIGCTFSGNVADIGGGILCNNCSSPTISNCLITENTALSYGGGVHISVCSNPWIGSTTICNNEPDQLTMAGTYEDGGENHIDDICPADCDGDINGDGEVGVDEVLAVIAAWGTDDADADVNDDGIVDTNDLLFVLSAWGPCP